MEMTQSPVFFSTQKYTRFRVLIDIIQLIMVNSALAGFTEKRPEASGTVRKHY
jgi:hypothetical protein